MIRPEPQIIKSLASAVRQYPELLIWIKGWYNHELEKLPFAATNTAVAQGRCQVLGELSKFADESPDLAAKI